MENVARKSRLKCSPMLRHVAQRTCGVAGMTTSGLCLRSLFTIDIVTSRLNNCIAVIAFQRSHKLFVKFFPSSQRNMKRFFQNSSRYIFLDKAALYCTRNESVVDTSEVLREKL